MTAHRPFTHSFPDWGNYPSQTLCNVIPGGLAELYHHGADDPSVRRLRIWWKQFAITLLPTKALAVLECAVDGKPLFWDPPLDSLKDPRAIDLSGEFLIEGKRAPGAAWIAQFIGGIEMLGLDNWGMHRTDAAGNIHILHGNLSFIPATSVTITHESQTCLRIMGTVTVYDGVKILAEKDSNPQWKVERTVVLHADRNSLEVEDVITNVSEQEAFADWGYHVELRPQDGCSFLLPSRQVRERFGNPLPADHAVWRRAKRIDVREEHGYVHSDLDARDGMVHGLLEYPDGTGIGISIPHSPYTLAWNSSGGAGSKEFLWASDVHTPIFDKPWDGVGPEIGASDLDHGTQVDPDVTELPLAPGASRRLRMEITPLTRDATAKERERIISCQTGRTDDQDIFAMATHVWHTAIHELERLDRYVDRASFVSCVRLLAQKRGRVFVCGVGTSGVAARKLAHSLSCVEIPSCFLNPADAVHGALGAVQEGDLVFLISKGGGTREIVQLLPSLQAKHTTTIAITENPDSELGRSCDLVLRVAIEKEADTFNMLATTSTLTVIALFDALAIAAMQVTGYTKEQFAIIHPSGAVGDRLLKKT